jgi:hypothetical protein
MSYYEFQFTAQRRQIGQLALYVRQMLAGDDIDRFA